MTVPVPDPLFSALTATEGGGGGGDGGGAVPNFASTKIALSMTKLQIVDCAAHIAPAGDPEIRFQAMKFAPVSGTAVILT